MMRAATKQIIDDYYLMSRNIENMANDLGNVLDRVGFMVPDHRASVMRITIQELYAESRKQLDIGRQMEWAAKGLDEHGLPKPLVSTAKRLACQ